MKKSLVHFVLCVALIVPVGVQAILPLIVGGLVMATNSTTLTTALVGSAAVVGAVLAFIGMGGASNGSPADAPILVQLNESEPLPIPSGYSAPVAPATQPVPPSSVAAGTCWKTSSPTAYCGSSAVDARLEYVNRPGNGGPSAYTFQSPCVETGTTSTGCGVTFNATGSFIPLNPANGGSCPAGRTMSGGVCVTSNAALIMKPSDSKCTIVRSGNTFSGDPNDPDCAAGLPTTVTVGTNTITVEPSTAVKQKVVINGDGSTTTTNTVINTSNNTTTTTTINASGSGVGNTKITGIGVTTVNGTGDVAGTGTVPGSELPTDYNRETTQQAIQTKLGQIKDGQCGGTGQVKCDVKVDEAGTPTDGSLTAQRDAHTIAEDARKDSLSTNTSKSSLPFSFGISWPASVGCTNPTLSTAPMKGQTLTVKVCELGDGLRPAMNWIMGVLTAFCLFGIAVSGTKT